MTRAPLVMDMHTSLDESGELLAWLAAFRRRNGRALRVLHIGNIANNAFLNAKFLRSVGVDAYVVSHDYDHVMAFPEWEEVELIHGHGEDYEPRFSAADLKDYVRPRWFISGKLSLCASKANVVFDGFLKRNLKYLYDKARIQTIDYVREKLGLIWHDRLIFAFKKPHLLLFAGAFWLWMQAAALAAWAPGFLKPARATRLRVASFTEQVGAWIKEAMKKEEKEIEEGVYISYKLIARFKIYFPKRADKLDCDDISTYLPYTDIYKSMFEPFDIVQCYATEPILAVMSEKQPYVAFEHGTLRDFTMGDDPVHRLTALGYRMADHSFVTNGDCLEYAERLRLTNYSGIVHPIDVEQHRQDFGTSVERLRRELEADVVLFCPIRHDWEIKGTDIHLRALPLIKKRHKARIKLVLVHWGKELADSKKLISELGCTDDVVWHRSMCRITMIKHMRAADVVLDQMALPHFGGTAPQAMAAGTPVVSSYRPESTRWIIPEPAPILSAFTSEEVADAVDQALDPDWRRAYEERARSWIDRYHHPDIVVREHLKVYRRILERADEPS